MQVLHIHYIRTVFTLYSYGTASLERINKSPTDAALNHFGLHVNLQRASRAGSLIRNVELPLHDIKQSNLAVVPNMVGKVSERVLLREGLERTDNGMKLSTWPDVTPINQKNYYTYEKTAVGSAAHV
ncbi:hypothetical protein NQ176_g10569 [Zarea fungicola]|uniref:Uncharacterized protein n=1 Tax=Zarea fungicola TaxID=93591 RepID=A0ACC1MFS4_9HYPO|nr:hypothetical protein NQ176_g10569 [Lecanicillium fungicola]